MINQDNSRNNDSLPRQHSKTSSVGEKSSKAGNSGFGVDISLIPNANDTSLEKSTMAFSSTTQKRQQVKNLLSTKSLISTINKKQGQSPTLAY